MNVLYSINKIVAWYRNSWKTYVCPVLVHVCLKVQLVGKSEMVRGAVRLPRQQSPNLRSRLDRAALIRVAITALNGPNGFIIPGPESWLPGPLKDDAAKTQTHAASATFISHDDAHIINSLFPHNCPEPKATLLPFARNQFE